jgi:hypothetical protein
MAPTFLLAHTDKSGAGSAAQSAITAKTESEARKQFALLFPERVVTQVGVREGRAPTRRERRGRP